MGLIRNILFCCFLCCCCSSASGQYIQVDDTYTAQQLVENVLINSPCANVSNFNVTGDPNSTGANSYGYFTAGTSGFPFAKGIVLSTAKAKRSEGPNTNLITEGLDSWVGDNDLERALNISGTYNATVLEFDFTPLASTVSFDYIFASEEYHDDAPCKYSDGFAFLLKEAGSSSPYQNLALIPNTNTPVLVTTVHPAITVPGGCDAVNEEYFGSYNGSNAPINFNGQTVVMTAKATVTPGVTYHIKLVIADQQNPQFDSSIFIGGGSFNVGTDLGEDQLIANNNPVCQGKTFPLTATEPGNNLYKWYRNSVPIPGANTALYTVSQPGDYKVEITLGTTACVATGEITIEYVGLPVLADATIVQCDDDRDGTTLYNLTTVSDIIRNGDPNLEVHYYESLIAAQNQDSAFQIQIPESYPSVPKTIYASASDSFRCSSVAEVHLQITANSVTRNRDYETCDLDSFIDGYYTFDLRDIDPVVLDGLPLGLTVEYYPTAEDAQLQINALPDAFTNTTQYQMYIYAKVIDAPDCYGIMRVHLFVNNNSPDDFGDETIPLCENGSATLEVADTFSTYNWSTGNTTDYRIDVTTPGDYTVTVSDNNTCLATKKFIVVLSQKPVIKNIDIDNFNENGSSVIIQYGGNGNYEFSLDGNFYQDSPYFADVAPGEYLVKVRDKNGCGEDSEPIYVFNYPKYFTPNGDGYNDIWTIRNLSQLSNAKIDIFDRYGKLLYQFSANQKGWDGKLNSQPLPSDDYWFVITAQNNKTVRGHFALKR